MQVTKQLESARLMKSDAANYREIALRTILQRSFIRGSRKLSSGKISEYYIDMKPSMLDPHGAEAIAHLIFQRLQSVDVELVGGLEMGAVPLVCNLTMLSAQYNRPLPGYFVRKAPKDHGTQKLIEGSDPAGRNVVILDDVTTSGASAMKAVEATRQAGGFVLLVLSVVDRQEGATEFYRGHNIPFGSLFTRDQLMAASAASSPSTLVTQDDQVQARVRGGRAPRCHPGGGPPPMPHGQRTGEDAAD